MKRILSVTVDDDPANPHSDEVIEKSVEGFDIETWDWMKFDMCSDTIHAAAKNVRDLTLYWSGRRAVLKSWAAPDGLAKLASLFSLYILLFKSCRSNIRTSCFLPSSRAVAQADIEHRFSYFVMMFALIQKASFSIS